MDVSINREQVQKCESSSSTILKGQSEGTSAWDKKEATCKEILCP